MADAAGKWEVVLNTPMGAQNITLDLKVDGTELSGTGVSPMGTQEFSGGSFDGENVALSMNITAPMPMTIEFEGKVEGDTVNGTAKLGAFGTSTWSGKRVGA